MPNPLLSPAQDQALSKLGLEPPHVPIPVDTRPTQLEQLVEVHRIVSAAMDDAKPYGPLPSIRSDEWMAAPIEVKIASILCLGQAYLICDPERQALEMLRDASSAFSSNHDWTHSVSHAELTKRRSAPGPTPSLISDPASVARWVATGDSEEQAA